jgi:hypothetical protein
MNQTDLILTLAWATNRVREHEEKINEDATLISALRNRIAELTAPPVVPTREAPTAPV